MKSQVVRSLLKALKSRLVITTEDGTTFRVPKSEYIVLNREGDVMALFAEGRKLRILDTSEIKRIKTENPAAKRK